MAENLEALLVEAEETRGERTLLVRLVQAFQPQLSGFLGKRLPVGHKHQADDLFQTTFLRVNEALSLDRFEWRNGFAFRKWLYQIALNVVTDWLKANSRAKRDFNLTKAISPEDVLPGSDPSPSTPLRQKEKNEKLKQLLNQYLGPDQAKIMELRHFDGLSWAEIAQLLGKSEASLRQIGMRSLENLRAVLNKSDFVSR